MEYIELIASKLRQGKRVWSYCSSYSVIKLVEQYCIKEGLTRPRVYHGKNLILEDELND